MILKHESWGRRLSCQSVDGSSLTLSNMIHLESSGSCEKARIVLVFENQGYVLDKPLPVTLPEGSSPEERLTFEKWHEDNRKVRNIILASMTNEIQKQYDRLEDVPSIMLRIKEVYAVPDRHIRYTATKSLPPSYDPFIVNNNMNELEKSIHELINMLVQYEATTHKSKPTVLVGEASTSKAKGKGARRWKRKKGKRTAVTATASTEGAPPTAPKERAKGRLGVLSGRRQMMSACIAKERGIGRGSVHNSSPTQVLERTKKLSKDEMILRLGDGKAIAAEAMGSLSLVSNLIMIAQHKRKVDNYENAQIWHARLGHISKDRIRRLIDSKSLEIDNLDHLPTCESCLKGKMTKKPFVGQSAIANCLLDLVHMDVCGSLSIPARGEFSYFITFTDDYSRGEFIDYLKENGILSQCTPPGTPQLNGAAERRNRTLLDMVQFMMSFTELPPSFWGYALETAAKLLNIAPSKSVLQTPYEIWHGKPASYKYLGVWGSPAYVKRLVEDKLDSRSSLCRFIGYPKKNEGYYFYDSAEQKIFVSRNAVFLKKDFPSDSRRDEVLIEESNEEPHHDSTTSFEATVHADGVPVLRRSTRESRVPERYEFVGLTSQLDNDPKTYGEVMSDIDSDK
ncbi:UNVERIFIED_CONTAM: hypothetical protein Slati_1469300 [Sesamum latifolium]|uniref:Integrase catalytic domain-containing protein n=1 Tax=Sesamum latifolium TaxID=2727402 RepID=A0AAW2X7D2_9LAMI